MAAQFLSGRGFKEVYSLKGGIKAWQGIKAVGPVELNLDLIRGDESPAEMIETAYGMEGVLGNYYQIASEEVKDAEVAALLKKLKGIEERHQQLLMDQYGKLNTPDFEGPQILVDLLPPILEGGFRFSEFLNQNKAAMQTVSGVLDVAMMVETQALDLYLRFGRKTTEESTQKILYKIADEEKTHLEALGKLRDKESIADLRDQGSSYP